MTSVRGAGDSTTGPRALSWTTRALLAALASAVLAAAVHLAAQALDVSFVVTAPGGGEQEVGLGPTAAASALAAAVGTGLARLLSRTRPARARDLWLLAVAVVLIASGANAVTAAADTSTAVALNGLHLAAAVGTVAVVLPALRSAPRRV